MGMRTTIYGYIEEMDFWLDPIENQVREHNSSIINSLPVANTWPPLSREMFAISINHKNDPGPNLFKYKVIHDGKMPIPIKPEDYNYEDAALG